MPCHEMTVRMIVQAGKEDNGELAAAWASCHGCHGMGHRHCDFAVFKRRKVA